MIGRASIGHPWILNEIKHFMVTGEHLASPTVAARVGGRPPTPTQFAGVEGPWKVWWRCGATTAITSRAYPT